MGVWHHNMGKKILYYGTRVLSISCDIYIYIYISLVALYLYILKNLLQWATRSYLAPLKSGSTVLIALLHTTPKCSAHTWHNEGERIILGTDWKTAAQYERFPKDLTRVDLWIDSTDFCLSGKLSTPRSDLMWSYKCNSPGCRYTFLADARGQIRKVWGGYSLKTYDGMFLQQQATWLEEQLAGARVIADTHYEWGTKNLSEVEIITPIPAPRGRRKRDLDGNIIEKTLTAKQRKYNQHVHSMRSRIENVFGRLGQKVGALSNPFWEGELQLDYLVWFAAGLLNEEWIHRRRGR